MSAKHSLFGFYSDQPIIWSILSSNLNTRVCQSLIKMVPTLIKFLVSWIRCCPLQQRRASGSVARAAYHERISIWWQVVDVTSTAIASSNAGTSHRNGKAEHHLCHCDLPAPLSLPPNAAAVPVYHHLFELKLLKCWRNSRLLTRRRVF